MPVRLALALSILMLLCGCLRSQAAQSDRVRAASARCLQVLQDGSTGSDGDVEACTTAIASGAAMGVTLANLHHARGDVFCVRTDYDKAIVDQTEAIRLKPDYADAYFSRGECYWGKRNDAAALADFAEAIRLNPDAGYFMVRARFYNWHHQHDLAVADYDQALKIRPDLNTAVDERAKTIFDEGHYEAAVVAFQNDVRAFPDETEPYVVLWLHAARLRAHQPDAEEFEANLKRYDVSGWPAPITDLFLGKSTLQAMHQRAMLSPYGSRRQICEARVFGAEYALGQGNKADATQLLWAAFELCDPKESPNTYLTAAAELGRLDPRVNVW